MEKNTKRKGVSKKLRFEVFKRDNFTCQYCGNKAPDVILEVDHITPVSKGGKNNILNLITSCRDCNRGKSKNLLTDHQVLDKERNQMEELQERKEQLKMMMQWHDELLQMDDDQINYIQKLLLDDGNMFTAKGRVHIKKQVERFGFETIIKAAKIAKESYEDGEERIAKIGGIAYNKLFVDKEW